MTNFDDIYKGGIQYVCKRKKNNGGFSLVELIVVIAISVVLIGAATISIRSVMGVEVKQCARNIESIINKTRVTTMGKDSAVLEIYKDASDGAYYYKTTINGVVSDPSKIGKSRIDVYYSMKDDYSDKTQLNSSGSIVLQFDRSSGAQKPDANGKCCSRIWIQKTAQKRLSRYTRRPVRWYVSNLHSLMMNILF